VTEPVPPTGAADGLALPPNSRALLDAVVAISSDLDLHSVLKRIVTSACQITDARYGTLGVIGPGGGLSDFLTHGVSEEEHAAIGGLPRGHGILGLLIDHPQPIRLHHLQDHPKSFGFPPNHPPMERFLGVPVRIRGTVFGNLYLTEKAGGQDFTEQDEQLVEALASAAGFMIENARDYARSERRRQWLEASAQVNEALQPPVRLDDALRQIAIGARRVSRASAVAVVRRAEQGGHDLLAWDGRRADDLEPMVVALEQHITEAEVQGSLVVVPRARAHGGARAVACASRAGRRTSGAARRGPGFARGRRGGAGRVVRRPGSARPGPGTGSRRPAGADAGLRPRPDRARPPRPGDPTALRHRTAAAGRPADRGERRNEGAHRRCCRRARRDDP
jgi:GAF domain-containing protein